MRGLGIHIGGGRFFIDVMRVIYFYGRNTEAFNEDTLMMQHWKCTRRYRSRRQQTGSVSAPQYQVGTFDTKVNTEIYKYMPFHENCSPTK